MDHRFLVPKILAFGIAGAVFGGLIDAAFGGWLGPAQWPVIIGTSAGLMIGRIVAMRSLR